MRNVYTLSLDLDTGSKLLSIASRTGRTPNQIVKELVHDYDYLDLKNVGTRKTAMTGPVDMPHRIIHGYLCHPTNARPSTVQSLGGQCNIAYFKSGAARGQRFSCLASSLRLVHTSHPKMSVTEIYNNSTYHNPIHPGHTVSDYALHDGNLYATYMMRQVGMHVTAMAAFTEWPRRDVVRIQASLQSLHWWDYDQASSAYTESVAAYLTYAQPALCEHFRSACATMREMRYTFQKVPDPQHHLDPTKNPTINWHLIQEIERRLKVPVRPLVSAAALDTMQDLTKAPNRIKPFHPNGADMAKLLGVGLPAMHESPATIVALILRLAYFAAGLIPPGPGYLHVPRAMLYSLISDNPEALPDITTVVPDGHDPDAPPTVITTPVTPQKLPAFLQRLADPDPAPAAPPTPAPTPAPAPAKAVRTPSGYPPLTQPPFAPPAPVQTPRRGLPTDDEDLPEALDAVGRGFERDALGRWRLGDGVVDAAFLPFITAAEEVLNHPYPQWPDVLDEISADEDLHRFIYDTGDTPANAGGLTDTQRVNAMHRIIAILKRPGNAEIADALEKVWTDRYTEYETHKIDGEAEPLRHIPGPPLD